jgi:hypothetical protein
LHRRCHREARVRRRPREKYETFGWRLARMTPATNTPCKQRGCGAAQERDQDPRRTRWDVVPRAHPPPWSPLQSHPTAMLAVGAATPTLVSPGRGSVQRAMATACKREPDRRASCCSTPEQQEINDASLYVLGNPSESLSSSLFESSLRQPFE